MKALQKFAKINDFCVVFSELGITDIMSITITTISIQRIDIKDRGISFIIYNSWDLLVAKVVTVETSLLIFCSSWNITEWCDRPMRQLLYQIDWNGVEQEQLITTSKLRRNTRAILLKYTWSSDRPTSKEIYTPSQHLKWTL